MRVRHRLSKLFLRRGTVYSGGTPWTCVHETCLRKQRFTDHHRKAAFDHSFDAVLAATAARARLDEQILDVAASARFADPVNRLGCLCGISDGMVDQLHFQGLPRDSRYDARTHPRNDSRNSFPSPDIARAGTGSFRRRVMAFREVRLRPAQTQPVNESRDFAPGRRRTSSNCLCCRLVVVDRALKPA